MPSETQQDVVELVTLTSSSGSGSAGLPMTSNQNPLSLEHDNEMVELPIISGEEDRESADPYKGDGLIGKKGDRKEREVYQCFCSLDEVHPLIIKCDVSAESNNRDTYRYQGGRDHENVHKRNRATNEIPSGTHFSKP